jgi:parallel beta-helix repeat protein
MLRLEDHLEVVLLGFMVFALISPISTNSQMQGAHTSLMSSTQLAQSHVRHIPIAINGNHDLIAQAAAEGWKGSGTASDPILISGYLIEESRHLFRIVNTDLHFIFADNYLNGIDGYWCGIYLSNVTNGIVANNTVHNAAIGLHMLQIHGCVLADNTIYNNRNEGIVLELPCYDNNVTGNDIHDNGIAGIIVDYGSQNNVISGNRIGHNEGAGIYLWQYLSEPWIANNLIVENWISCQSVGIIVQGHNNNIQNNTIIQSSTMGIQCSGVENLIEGNAIANGSRNGVLLFSYAANNTVQLNSIQNNTLSGIKIARYSVNNFVLNNDLVENNDTLQVCDDGQGNLFLHNFYSNWNIPDSNNDTYVDYPYPVYGSAGNNDTQPRTAPNLMPPFWYQNLPVNRMLDEERSRENQVWAFLPPILGITIVLAISMHHTAKKS